MVNILVLVSIHSIYANSVSFPDEWWWDSYWNHFEAIDFVKSPNKSEDSMTLSNPTSGSVQISALGFLAAVFCWAASASSACEVIPISAQTAYVGIPTYPNKINQRLQQIPVIYCHLSTPSRCHRRCGWGGCTLSWRGIRHPGSTFSRMVDSQTSDG